MLLSNADALIKVNGLRLVGIMGKARTGKDTVAKFVDRYSDQYINLPMAFALKQYCAEKYGIDLQDFHSDDKKEVPNKYWGVSPRQIIQYEGTELTRQGLTGLFGYDTFDFWIHRHAGVINEELIRTMDCEGEDQSYWFDKHTTVVVPDVRFQNEYDYIVRNNGLIIDLAGSPQRIDGEVIGIANHESEKLGINKHAKDQTYALVNDGTLEELHHKVNAIMANSDKHRVAYSPV